MKTTLTHHFTLTLFLVVLFLLPVYSAEAVEYTPLVNLEVGGGSGFAGYVDGLYYLSIGLAALLAVIKITIAGVKWMLSDIVTDKSQAKKDIQGSLLGLLVIVSAVLVLNIINPELTNVNLETSDLSSASGLGQDLITTGLGAEVCGGVVGGFGADGECQEPVRSRNISCGAPGGINGLYNCEAAEQQCRDAVGDTKAGVPERKGVNSTDASIACYIYF